MTTPLDLVKDARALVDDIRRQLGGQRPAIVVIDTLNRSMSGSESSDEDMAAYIRASDAIRAAFGCLVVVIHHCGHDKNRPAATRRYGRAKGEHLAQNVGAGGLLQDRMKVRHSSVIGGSSVALRQATQPYRRIANGHRKPLARYGARGSALRERLAPSELHHRGGDTTSESPSPSTTNPKGPFFRPIRNLSALSPIIATLRNAGARWRNSSGPTRIRRSGRR